MGLRARLIVAVTCLAGGRAYAQVETATVATSTAAEVAEELRELAKTSSTSTAAIEAASIEAPAAPEKLALRVVYTGASYGIGSGRYGFDLPERVEELVTAAGGKLTSALAYHGVLAQGLTVVIASDYKVETVVRMLDDGPITCAAPRPALSIRSPRNRLLYAGDLVRYPPWIGALDGNVTRRDYEARTCTSAAGQSAVLYSPVRASFTPPVWKLEEFELRIGLHLVIERDGAVEEAEIIGIPEAEPARRFHLLDTLAKKPNTIYVDAGSFLDGASSVKDGELSAHRPLGFSMLERLEPAALVPGETELLGGVRAFLEEARAHRLDYVATNWSAEDPALELPDALLRDVVTDDGVVRIAFLGVIDPRLRDWTSALGREGITVDDPVSSVQEVVRALRKRPVPPDLVIVLTSAAADVTETLERRLRGVDLVIGERSEELDRVRAIELDLRPDIDARRNVAAVLPVFDVTTADLELYPRAGTYALRRVVVEPRRTTEGVQTDRRTLARVTRTRAELYPALDRPLLAAPVDGPLAKLGHTEWRKLVCEAVLRYTNADVVFLPRLPSTDRVPGPLTELLVANRLATLDRLEAHAIPGTKMIDLLRQAGDIVTTACGAAIGIRANGVIRGRGVDPETVYRVVTTDRARSLGLDKLFDAAYSPRLLDRRGARTITGEGGAPLTLRRAVIEELRKEQAQAAQTYAPVAPLLVDSAGVKPPRWSLRFSRLSLRLERFRGAGDDAFARVPETLATSPSSLSLAGDADVALIYDSTSFIGDLRLRSQYARLAVGDAPVQEPADDLRLSSSASLPGLSLPAGPLKWMPFFEVLLDSEITRIEQEGMKLPRQADLSFTLGLSLVPVSILKVLRVGGFVLRDLARDERPAEVGGRAELSTSVIFGPELRFETIADATVFASTSEDDDSDLRFKSLLETRLATPLVRFLDVGLFARAFIFSGRVPETDHVRASYMIGFSLDLHGVLHL